MGSPYETPPNSHEFGYVQLQNCDLSTSTRLTCRTEKRGSLGLHDALNVRSFATGACFSGSTVHSMMVLIPPRAIQRIAVGTVGERRPLIPDRFLKDRAERFVQTIPFQDGQPTATFLRMDPSDMQDLGCVQISDSGEQPFGALALENNINGFLPLAGFLGVDVTVFVTHPLVLPWFEVRRALPYGLPRPVKTTFTLVFLS